MCSIGRDCAGQGLDRQACRIVTGRIVTGAGGALAVCKAAATTEDEMQRGIRHNVE
jgi:hypothetical protein